MLFHMTPTSKIILVYDRPALTLRQKICEMPASLVGSILRVKYVTKPGQVYKVPVCKISLKTGKYGWIGPV